MITFWVVAVCLLVAVVALLAVPLVRRHAGSSGVDEADSNVALFRDQLLELERDRDLNLLSPEQFEQARIELGQRLLADVPANEAHSSARAARGAWRYAALACLPIATVSGYLVLGTPEALNPEVTRAQEGLPPGHAANLAQLADKLAARLVERPDDVEAWVLLARSYQRLGRNAEAVKAFARALELVPDAASLHADYADALVASAEGRWTPEALAAVNRSLAIDPQQPKALWLAGTEAFVRKDYGLALRHWEKLAPLTEPGSEVARIIQSNIAEARALMQAAGGSAPAPAATAASKPAASPAEGGTLTGTVALDPKLMAHVKPTDTVFVFARAAQGPKLPLAIRRITAEQLPYQFVLDDAAAMAPGMVISKFDQVVVGARVSRSGDATPKPGDLEGFSAPVKPGAGGIRVQINARVE